MRFLYKIHSGFDGFRPAVIPQRMAQGGGRLRLVWRRYIDVVEKGWECWIYFHGPHRFDNGVYVEGIVDDVDLVSSEVSLRVRKHSTTSPIAGPETCERVAEVVAPRYRQVFVWPDDWTVAPECGLAACLERRCEDCVTWVGLPLIQEGHATAPKRLRWSVYEDVVPAYWMIPRRCYARQIESEIRELTRRFTGFKLGEMAYAFPFARGMFEQLRRRELLDYDFVVPVPLSPDKVANGEVHRTLELARELGRLLAVPVREVLTLTSPVSKRRMKAAGYTTAEFERAYRKGLCVDLPAETGRILLVDDVMTGGSTAAQALSAIRAERPEAKVVVATAGQMIVKESVVVAAGFSD